MKTPTPSSPGLNGLLAALAAFLFLTAGPAAAYLAPTPSQATVSPGTANQTFTITWFLSTSWADGAVTSAGGSVSRPGDHLYSTAGPLTATVSGGRGSVTETVTIQRAWIDEALAAGYDKIRFARSFTQGMAAESASVTLSLGTSPLAGGLSLLRVELAFREGASRQGGATVARGSLGLAAEAVVHGSGSGWLEGYWEVDGRLLEKVGRQVSGGGPVTLVTSNTPGLPALSPGLHRVRLVVANPSPPFPLPEIAYLVTAGDGGPAMIAFSLPGGRDRLAPGTALSWAPPGTGPAAAAWVLTITRESDGEKAFSALTLGESYRLPTGPAAPRLLPGAAYLVTIQGFDAEGRLLSESRPARFIAD